MVGKQVTAIVIGGVVLFGLYSIIQSGNETTKIVDDVNRRSETMNEVFGKIEKGWKYSTDKDEMRGKVAKRAELVALPYDEFAPVLTVWQKDGKENAQLGGSIRQAVAPNPECDYRTNVLSVKFDDGPVREFGCNMGMSVAIDPSIVAKIKTAKRMMVETDTSVGKQQFTFDVAGLKL